MDTTSHSLATHGHSPRIHLRRFLIDRFISRRPTPSKEVMTVNVASPVMHPPGMGSGEA